MFGDIAAGDWFMLLVRWVHAIGAVAWIGGSAFFAFVLRPVEAANPELVRPVLRSIGSVYREMVDIAVIAIIVSGLILMFDRLTGDDASPAWFIVLGV
ncbi:MAG: urate hydroxylase PuuD, partial [Chloroflexi bacterium]|nr:urate hydroxylase PuuD [Chloroflexota bacterium]